MRKILKRSLSLLLAITIIFSSAYVGLNRLDSVGGFAIETKAAGTSFNDMLERANALVNYEWTPSKRIYTWNNNYYNGKKYFEAGKTVKGIPYTLFTSEIVGRSQCSLSDYKKVVNSNYSVTEYCVSARDKKGNILERTGPVYGSCCASFVAEVFGGRFVNKNGHPVTYNVGGIKDTGKTTKNVLAKNIVAGDAISDVNGYHVVWVGAVSDSTITIYECTPPVAQKVVLKKSSNVNSSGYLVYDGKTYSVVTKSPDITNTLNVYFNANGGNINSDTYKLTNNLVYNISDGSKKYQPWVYNNPKTNGLINYTSLGLYRTGYTFVGWGTTSSGETIFDQDDASILPTDINSNVATGNCSTTLYAIWEPNELNVYYNANGGSIASDTYKLSSNIVCNLSDNNKVAQLWTYNNKKSAGLYNTNSMGLYKTGYTFVGWGTTPSGGTVFDQNDGDLFPTSINSNLKNGDCSTTLYAIWEPNTLNVYYNANGGSINSDSYKISSNIVCNISDGSKVAQLWAYNNKKSAGLYNINSMGLYKTGYTFTGWGTTSDGGTVFDQNDGDLLPASISSSLKNGNCSTTLYAIWVPNKLNVYFNGNGGSVVSDTYKLSNDIICNIDGSEFAQAWTYNNKKTYGLPSCGGFGLSRTGYKFIGWGTTPDGGTIYDQTDVDLLPMTINSNLKNGDCSTTLYAIWQSEDDIHSYTIEEIITEPTCTTSGLQKLYCSVHSDCGMYKEVVIPATGHIYGDWEFVLYPTCTTIGSKIQKCVCGETITESIDVIEHNFSEEWTIDAVPTCTVDGSKSHHCVNENCAEKTDVTIIDAPGHIYGEWEIVSYSTCTTNGSKIKSCDCGDTITENIDVLEHDYSEEWTIDKDSTCTEDGSKSHHCLICDNKTDVTVITTLGHDYVAQSVKDTHPHTTVYNCSFCEGTKTETPYMQDCVECNFSITAIDSSSYKLVSYIGKETDIVIPASYNGRTITSIANSCFKGNSTITSVKVADNVTSIGALAFMNCTELEKVVIPSSVASIGIQAFYGFTGTIYCTKNSTAYDYAMSNNIDYVIMSILETADTKINYDDFVIYTNIENCDDITKMLRLTDTVSAIPTASYVYGHIELYGTGTVITVFDGNDYIGDFTLVVNGDTNGDSVCDALDAAQVANVSNGHKTIDGAYKMAADNNSDDIVDIEDYQAIVNQVVA